MPGNPTQPTADLTRDLERVVPSAPGTSPGRKAHVPVLLTTAEVAAVLRTSRKAIYTMIERAQLPRIVRIGRRVLVRHDALLDFLDHNCTPSPREYQR
jgi:excisionase family DNA binding protein